MHARPEKSDTTFALNFLKQHPGKLVELSVLLGHDSVETTAIYTQPSAEEMAEDLERSPLNVEPQPCSSTAGRGVARRFATPISLG